MGLLEAKWISTLLLRGRSDYQGQVILRHQGAGTWLVWNCSKQLRVKESGSGCVEESRNLSAVVVFVFTELIYKCAWAQCCALLGRVITFSMCLLHKCKHFYAPIKCDPYLNCLVMELVSIHI